MTKQYGTPGPRAIYPEMCDSPSLGRCRLLANALFPRLIAQADDQGRLAGGPQAILLQCMPRLLGTLTVDQVAAALDELEAAGMLVQYEHQGEAHVQLTQWWRWQQGQRRAYPSRWAGPRGWADVVYGIDAEGPKSFAEAVAGISPRNAAIRSIVPRIAARATGACTGARAPGRARGVPGRATAEAVPPARGSAASGAARSGPMMSAGEALSEFSSRVPRPEGAKP